MFEATRHRSTAGSLFATLELIYHSAVRDVRKGHRLAVVGLLLTVLQTLIFVVTFYLMFWMIGAHQTTQFHGEFVMYLMTGIFPFMFHTKAMAAVVRTDGPSLGDDASRAAEHADLDLRGGPRALYTQMLSLLILLFFYHTLWHPLEIDNPGGALGCC